MTEAEWLVCADPEALLRHYRLSLGKRKGRLFAVAICLQIRDLFTEPATAAALTVAEAFADQKASDAELQAAAQRAAGVYDATPVANDHDLARRYAAAAVAHCAGRVYPSLWTLRSATATAQFRQSQDADAAAFAALLRDIVGNPFQPVAFSPAWRTDTAVLLARQMYESRDFGAMPILADALQDAGCDSADILDHCRDPKSMHVRGCWVVDAVLGKV